MRILGCQIDKKCTPQEPAVLVCFVRDDDDGEDDRPVLAPLVCFNGPADLPEDKYFIGFIPGGAHIWQVRPDGVKEAEPLVTVHSTMGDIHTGPNGAVFGPDSPIVG